MKKILTIILTVFAFCSAQAAVNNNNNGNNNVVYDADNCLDGQDMDAEDVDISNCPAISEFPEDVKWLGQEGDDVEMVSLGAWELGTTVDGDTYKYGSLNDASEEQRTLTFYDEEEYTNVDSVNVQCWAKGYFRLRKILQDPPAEYITLRDAGFQTRFFQFQTDLRNGTTGFKEIASYLDHLVKWVTRIELDGTCTQPTYTKFKDYSASELVRREL